jgi:hypothetical protein
VLAKLCSYRPSHATVVAYLALFVALGGASYAAIRIPARSVGARQLRNRAVTGAKIAGRAVTGAKIANGAVTGAKVSVSTFPAVPNARRAGVADFATSANSATSAGTAANADTAKNSAELDGRPSSAYVLARTLHPTSAFLESGWSSSSGFGAAGYDKDQFGIVHLFGAVGNASMSAGDLFTLPAGFRPGYIIDAVAHVGSTNTPPGLLHIATDGTVSPDNATNSVELEGITFAAGG